MREHRCRIRRSPTIAIFQVPDAGGPAGSSRTYRHEALLWQHREDFLAFAVPFLCSGLSTGESVLVAASGDLCRWIKDALGVAHQQVLFVDMAQLGRNPARLIPTWRRFVEDHCDAGQPVRGIGEPVWLGGRPEEMAEGRLHEALLNVAVEPDTPFWLVCPYQSSRLDPAAVEELHRSHPVVMEDLVYRGSHRYGGRDHVDLIRGSGLQLPPSDAEELSLTRASARNVSALVAAKAYAAGVGCAKAADLAVVVHQLANASLHRGADQAVLRIWSRPDAVICELRDEVVRRDPLIDRRPPGKDQRSALWTANELCDLVQVRSNQSGTTVRVHTWL